MSLPARSMQGSGAVPRGASGGSKESGMWALVTEMLSKTGRGQGTGKIIFPKAKTYWKWQKSTDAEWYVHPPTPTPHCGEQTPSPS